MPAKRTERVGALLKAALADLLLREVKDPRVQLVTVTGIDVSPDLKHARVFVSVLGDDDAHARSLAGLASARAFLQAQVGKRLGLRFTPELRFEIDPSFAAADRVERLLRDLHPPSAERDPDAGDESSGA